MVKNHVLCMACFCSNDTVVVAMTAQLNLAWFTRYEPQKQTVMTSLPSPSLGRALYNTMAFDPRMVLEEPNFVTREQKNASCEVRLL